MKKSEILGFAGLLALFFLFFGCASFGSYGKMRLVKLLPGKQDLEFLIEEWDKYNVYWAGAWAENPSAVLFDPKDEREVVPAKGWRRVNSRSMLEGLIWSVESNPRYPAALWELVGPNGQSFGYIYTAMDHVYTKLLDERHLWIEDIPLPPVHIWTRPEGVF